MFFARKQASTTDERSKGLDSQDPFAASEVPVAGALANPLLAPATQLLASNTLGVLNTNSIGYGSFGGQDLTDHFRVDAKPGVTYAVVVSTDSANGHIKTDAYADYFDLYFEDADGARLTAGFQVKELDLRTKLLEFTVPASSAASVPLFVQVDNALQKPFEYAIALFDKAAAPRIGVQATEQAAGRFLVTFTSDQVLMNSRPRADRIEVEGGTLSTLVRSSDGKSYSATFTPTAGSTLAPRIKALSGSFFNNAGDPNLDGDEANNAASLAPDKTPPAVASMTLVGPGLGVDVRRDVPYQLTVTFSEAVLGFDLNDVDLVGGTAESVARSPEGNGAVWVVNIIRNSDARAITPTILAGGYTDQSPSRNQSVEPASVSFLPDLLPPQGVFSARASHLQPGEQTEVLLSFNEPVTGLVESRLGVEGGSLVAGSLRAIDTSGRHYAFDVVADVDEDATPHVSLLLRDAEQITDAAGNHAEPVGTLTIFGAPFYFTSPAAADELGVTLDLVQRGEDTTFTLLLAGQDATTPDVELAQTTAETGRVTVPLSALEQWASGRLVARSVDLLRELHLRAALGTSGDDTLSVSAGEQPMVIYGFEGRDVLKDGEAPATLVGGDGVDVYDLMPGIAHAITVIEAGSPLAGVLGGGVNATGQVPVLREAFTGFDLVRGFDAVDSADRFKFLLPENTTLQRVRGVYDERTQTFSVDASGFDVMVFADEPGGSRARPDIGEAAVVLVGAAAVMDGLGG